MSDQQSVKKPKLTIAKVAENLDKVVESTNDAMTELRNTMDEQAETNKAILSLLQNQQKAINTPTSFGQETDTSYQDLGEGSTIGEEQNILVGTFDINSPQFAEKHSIEKFMREKVEIHIHESNNDLEVSEFSAGVNGDTYRFQFGTTRVVPRYIVESLARAKPETYNNVEKINSLNQVYTENKGMRGMRYPFSITRDTPVGRAWLQVVLKQH